MSTFGCPILAGGGNKSVRSQIETTPPGDSISPPSVDREGNLFNQLLLFLGKKRVSQNLSEAFQSVAGVPFQDRDPSSADHSQEERATGPPRRGGRREEVGVQDLTIPVWERMCMTMQIGSSSREDRVI